MMLALLLAALPAIAQAQSSLASTPAGVALAGSATARTESVWHALANPANIDGVGQPLLLSTFSPSAIGIEGFHEGGMIVAMPVDSALHLAAAAGTVGVHGYREVSARAIGAVKEGTFTFGVAVTIQSIAIDRYGSAVAPSVDLGMLGRLNDRISFGGSIVNITRSTISGVELPQRLALGFAFDLGTTALSFDLLHELRRSTAAALGISLTPVPQLVLRAGIASEPSTVSFGTGYELHGVLIEYGGAYISPLGFQHLFGAGVRL
jgi:hypothetical protein